LKKPPFASPSIRGGVRKVLRGQATEPFSLPAVSAKGLSGEDSLLALFRLGFEASYRTVSIQGRNFF